MKTKDILFYSVSVPSVLAFMLAPLLITVVFTLAINDFNISSLVSESMRQFIASR